MTMADPGRAGAGYSGTPLPRKLGIGPETDVLVVGAPGGFDLPVLVPDGVDLPETAATTLGDGPRNPDGDRRDVVLVFCPDVATLQRELPGAMAVTATAGRCWIAWPKRASKVPTDMTEDVARDAALAVGWVDVKVCAIDAVWSGLCLVRRKEHR